MSVLEPLHMCGSELSKTECLDLCCFWCDEVTVPFGQMCMGDPKNSMGVFCNVGEWGAGCYIEQPISLVLILAIIAGICCCCCLFLGATVWASCWCAKKCRQCRERNRDHEYQPATFYYENELSPIINDEYAEENPADEQVE